VSKGLATVVRYRQGDDQRSSCYDDLLKAEDRAEKKAVGMHSKKESPVVRVADISGVSRQCHLSCFVASLFFTKFHWLPGSRGLTRITVPNVVKIGQSLVEILQFFDFPI